MAVTSGIKTVQATINGQTYSLKLNNATGKYEATITAPNKSSYNNNAGHYYPVTLTVTDEAGNRISKDDTDGVIGESLKLKVKEKSAPTITELTPTKDSYLSTQAPTITAKLHDNDSGVNISSLILKVDDKLVSNSEIQNGSISDGFSISYTPKTALQDGPHTVSVQVADNDGNMSTAATTSFTVMSTAPQLTITSPADNLKTNKSALTISGTTSAQCTVKISLNGADQGAVSVGGDGSFTKAITLATEGENTIKITATNLAGVKTDITKVVLYDITAPTIKAININPNPVDSGLTYVISVEVTD